MPLNQACTLEALRENISAEIRAGKDPAQASAIAHAALAKACEQAGKAVPRSDHAEDGIQVRRYDTGEFRAPVRTPNGYLRCDGRITRIGVFEYKQADGSTLRELRLPGEVFKGDALKTFEDVPLTNGHPREKLDAKNTRKYAAGLVQGIREDDRFVAAKVLITDEQAIKDAEAGKTHLSCGYKCDLEFRPGVTSGIPGVQDGQVYNAIQRNIVGNHVAIVHKGRAGAEASLRLDAQDAVMVDNPPPKPTGPAPGPVGGKQMQTLKIDGIDYELEPSVAQAVGKLQTKLDELMESVKAGETKLVEEAARADQAVDDLAAERTVTQERYSPENLRKLVAERVQLETTAAAILKEDDLDLTQMTQADVQRRVVLKMAPGAQEKLDSADKTYLVARYNAAVEAWKEEQKNKPKPAHAVRVATKADAADSRSARQRMIENHRNLGRAPIRATTLDQ